VHGKGKIKNKYFFEIDGIRYLYTYDGLVAHEELDSCVFCSETGIYCCEFLTEIDFWK
jgi:hypothetical protein